MKGKVDLVVMFCVMFALSGCLLCLVFFSHYGLVSMVIAHLKRVRTSKTPYIQRLVLHG